jgi:GT2 family glycosyltransferase
LILVAEWGETHLKTSDAKNDWTNPKIEPRSSIFPQSPQRLGNFMRLKVVTDDIRHKATLQAIARSSPYIKIVEKNFEYIIYIRGIDSLSPTGIKKLLSKADDNTIIGELGYLNDLGQIVTHDIPAPQPEYFSRKTPKSYIVLTKSILKGEPESLFKESSSKKLMTTVGLVHKLDWNYTNKQESLFFKKKMVDLIVPTAVAKRKGVPLIYKMLDSLNLNENESINKVIVVVDNLIESGFVYSESSKIQVVDFRGKFNFSTKINLGLKYSSSEIVVIMNDDLVCKSKDWLENTIDSLNRPSVGIVGALLQYPNGKIQHAGIQLIESNPRHLFYQGESDDEFFSQLPKVYEVSAVTGAYMAIKRDILKLVQDMDENFPNNFGDIDLCFKLRENNLRCVQNNNVVFEHFESATRKRGVESKELSLLRFRWEHLLEEETFFSKDYSISTTGNLRILFNSLKGNGLPRTFKLVRKKIRSYFSS